MVSLMHLNRIMQSTSIIKKSPTLAINEEVNRLRMEGREIFSFGLGQSPFPVPDEVVAELKANAHQKDYLQVLGLKPLREAVASFHQRNDEVLVDPEHVLIGPGSKELIFQLMLCFPGEIILVTPCWVTYHPQALLLKKTTHFIHTSISEDWKLQPEKLQEVCKDNPNTPKLLILNYPSNPCGNSYSQDELKALATVARANNLLILSDEIYGLLNYSGKHYSIAHQYPEGTILSSGLSKWCGAGGWRLGTFSFPKQQAHILQNMIAVASETFTSVSAPIQFASISAFTGSPKIENYLEHSRLILSCIATWICEALSSVKVSVCLPEGGFYVFPDFEKYRDHFLTKNIRTSQELCNSLLKEIGVASLPGVAFGRAEEEFTIRLSFVSFDGGEALKVPASQIKNNPEAFIASYCPEIFQGVNNLLAWLKELSSPSID